MEVWARSLRRPPPPPPPVLYSLLPVSSPRPLKNIYLFSFPTGGLRVVRGEACQATSPVGECGAGRLLGCYRRHHRVPHGHRQGTLEERGRADGWRAIV